MKQKQRNGGGRRGLHCSADQCCSDPLSRPWRSMLLPPPPRASAASSAVGAAPAANILVGGVLGKAGSNVVGEAHRGQDASAGATFASARRRAGKREAEGHEAAACACASYASAASSAAGAAPANEAPGGCWARRRWVILGGGWRRGENPLEVRRDWRSEGRKGCLLCAREPGWPPLLAPLVVPPLGMMKTSQRRRLGYAGLHAR